MENGKRIGGSTGIYRVLPFLVHRRVAKKVKPNVYCFLWPRTGSYYDGHMKAETKTG
jgi:hypothetical protein